MSKIIVEFDPNDPTTNKILADALVQHLGKEGPTDPTPKYELRGIPFPKRGEPFPQILPVLPKLEEVRVYPAIPLWLTDTQDKIVTGVKGVEFVTTCQQTYGGSNSFLIVSFITDDPAGKAKEIARCIEDEWPKVEAVALPDVVAGHMVVKCRKKLSLEQIKPELSLEGIKARVAELVALSFVEAGGKTSAKGVKLHRNSVGLFLEERLSDEEKRFIDRMDLQMEFGNESGTTVWSVKRLVLDELRESENYERLGRGWYRCK